MSSSTTMSLPPAASLLERLQVTLDGLEPEHATSAESALDYLHGAVSAILSGHPLTSVIRDFSTHLDNVFADHPEIGRRVMTDATPIFAAAVLQAETSLGGQIRASTLDELRHEAPVPILAVDDPGPPSDELGSGLVPEWLAANPAVQALFETSAVGACLTTGDGTVIKVNQRFLDTFGVPADGLIGSRSTTLLSMLSEFTDVQLELLADHLRGDVPRIAIETIVERADGSTGWIAGDSIRLQGAEGGAAYYLSFIEDITDRQVFRRVQRNSEERFQALFQNSSDIIGVLSKRGLLEYVSDSIERILGYEAASLLGQHALSLVAAESQTSLEDIFREVLESSRGHARSLARIFHADGSWRWMEIDFTNLIDLPHVGGVVISARDVTERKSVEQQMERLAYYDTLTALPNRMHFRERLATAMAGLDRDGDRVAVVYLDLDRFKLINDRFGHDSGDDALVAVAQRILDTLRPGEMVARLGGEEFALLIEQATPARAMHTANRVIAAIAQKFPDHNRFFNLAASAGVAISSPMLNLPSEILRAADIAMYQGKKVGGGVATMFQPEMYDEAFARAELVRDLRLALDRQEMVPWFQPEFDLATSALCGFEVLMRWRRAVTQFATPEAFIGIAIELGMIVPFGLNILRTACERLVEWSTMFPHYRRIPITFNVSTREIAQPDYADRVAEILRDTGIDPSRLGIEIDDRVFREQSPALDRFVASIAKLGVHTIVDNFGGGHASWNQLRRLQVHGVKIAREAIAAEDHVEAHANILKAATALASASGIIVTGVGLETSDLVERAREIGCVRGQGFHLGPPLPAGGVPALLAQQSAPNNVW